ncbi:hypothetical protein Q0M94_19130 (plasmid) [Deinococcus radiomollis]|uniref:hypothetical protein n=1 Tax=Deinococcus radiomollis TaxID=468916 RepID=UPI003891F7A4
MNILDVLNMQITVKGLITEADTRFPGWRGADKEVWVTDFAFHWLQSFDNVIPVVGTFLNLPVGQTLEKEVVREVVKVVFDEVNKVAGSPAEVLQVKEPTEVVATSP